MVDTIGRRIRHWAFVVASLFLVPAIVAGQTPSYPLEVSTDGRYLIDQAGRPFFMNGEAAWSLISELSREDAELYLENRRQKGFNLVMVELIEHRFSSNAPANFYGAQPFTRSGDFSTPNEAYFAHADWVVRRAAEKGITVLLTPLYLGFMCNEEGWCGEVRAASMSTMRAYGRYVGSRYRDFPNIIWLIGGDTDPVAHGVGDKVREFVAGLEETDSNHLITAHNGPEQPAVEPWPNERWLDVNNIYTYFDAYPRVLQQYNRSPVKPVFLLETYYENEHDSTPLSLRRQAYWTVLSGGVAGHVFGNCEIWGFSRGYCAGPWKPQLESEGSRTVPLIGRLFNSRPVQLLVPDQQHEVVTSGVQSGSSYVAAARASNGSTVIAYIPSRRTIGVDMSKVGGGSVRAWWFNPRTGSASSIGTMAASGTSSFTPPDGNDWVLVLDNASLNLPPPGTPWSGTPVPPSAPRNVRVLPLQ